MRMNISVPDQLAEQVRELELPISSICQNALRDEVNRIRTIETADDILVYVESQQANPDPLTWPRFNPHKPTLTYKRYPVGRHWELGWVLEWEAGGVGGDPSDMFTPGEPGDPPIEWARHVMCEHDDAREGEELERIAAATGNPRLIRLVEDQNRLATAINDLLASAASSAGLEEIRQRLERLEQARTDA